METISLEALKEKVDRQETFKLVMTLGAGAFRLGHIPGSIHINNMAQAEELLSPEDDIVVYCHDENCPASKSAYQILASRGFTNVRRFAGGIRAWQAAGYLVEVEHDPLSIQGEPVILTQAISEEDHVLGWIEAPVMLVVYGDYECPYTRRTMTHVQGIRRRLGTDFCFAYRHFPAPVEIHPHAWMAAEAALAANEQGKFWEMHWLLFRNQRALESQHLAEYAAELNLDMVQFEDAQRDHLYQARIERDLTSGRDSGVEGIPTLFLNGIRYEGDMKLGAIMSSLESELNRRRK